ncbi:MAG TPA: class I SAM-dependent methyltransferase, partial [Pyrinomonadaceae bacterium]|nr:class I SAM-dependent methyltransferase [Pyrinomonadaceae bacterium]
MSRRTFMRGVVRLSKLISRKGLYEFLGREFARVGAGLEVLTVGAGGEVGALLEDRARRNGFRITSFDIDEKYAPDILGDICAHDFEGRAFDVIVLSEVLEHVHSPHLAIANIRAALRDGGRLILTVPFLFPIHERPHDYYRYTRYGLEFLLKDFREVSIGERNSWAEAINALAPRMVVDKNRRARMVAPLFVLAAFAKLPFVLLLGRLVRT